MSRAIVLVSGGMDSLVTLSIARRDYEVIDALHINYGQRTQEKELKCFQKICDHYSIRNRKVVDISYLKEFGGSSLTDLESEIPVAAKISNEIPNTYVPFRNGNLLSIASSYAEVNKVNHIYIGAVEVDGSGYPDCRRIFFQTLESAINNGIREGFRISICTPLIDLTKGDIVKLGKKLQSPFELSWSCYANGELPCGKCDSCVLRAKAFREAGCDDPIIRG